MGDKSAQNVHASIQRSKERTFDRLLCGLGIPQIGQVAARQLAEELVTLEAFLACTPEQVRERVDAIRGFGPKMVDSVVAFAGDEVQRRLMQKLVELGVGRPQPRHEVAADGPLSGSSFCVTGVLSKKREVVHADIRAAGGEVHDGVKKNTTYLVAGEKTGKSKLDQAKKFGTTGRRRGRPLRAHQPNRSRRRSMKVAWTGWTSSPSSRARSSSSWRWRSVSFVGTSTATSTR